jgi:hypothetical protein
VGVVLTAPTHLPVEQAPEHDTDVFNADGQAPLHLAAAGGHLGAVSFLLQKGSFVNMQDWEVSALRFRDACLIASCCGRDCQPTPNKQGEGRHQQRPMLPTEGFVPPRRSAPAFGRAMPRCTTPCAKAIRRW